jgi:WXXGXW repeat (2 copies)
MICTPSRDDGTLSQSQIEKGWFTMMTAKALVGRMTGSFQLLFYFVTPMSVVAQTPGPRTLAEEVLPTPAGIEVLAKGPVHESFAEIVLFDPTAGIVISQSPPEPIQEIPATEKPDDPSALWIPGYWGWDVDRKDFVWVSGVWRIPPPGRTWVPGGWTTVEGGYQWFSGYWSGAESQGAQPLPPPPNSLEVGPSSPSPGPQYEWTPGYWEWIFEQQTYVWHPGCWRLDEDNWVWVPSYYCRSPGGVIFVSGYRDFEFAGRGCLYSPIYFQEALYLSPSYTYRPCYPMNISLVASCLFVHPTTCHYYYGDYFSHTNRSRGYFPCHTFGSSYRGFDPFVGYGDQRSSLVRRRLHAQIEQQVGAFLRNPGLRPADNFILQNQGKGIVAGFDGEPTRNDLPKQIEQFRRKASRAALPDIRDPGETLNLPRGVPEKLSRKLPRQIEQRMSVKIPNVSKSPKFTMPAPNTFSAPPPVKFQSTMPRTFSMPQFNPGSGNKKLNFPSHPPGGSRGGGRHGKGKD